MKLVALLILFSFIFIENQAWAEPWISNRFAQNCASCHSPGRLNRKPSKRRCTLSCQACHVNPNGGGLRNQYGKWNGERWLRSFYSDLAWNKKSTAPLGKQHYAKKKLSKKKKKRYAKTGAKLVGMKAVVKNESPYFESSNYTAAKNQLDELSRIPKNDPYRLERRNMVTAGGDFRLFYIQQDNGGRVPKLEEGTFFPMVFDFGVRVRPLKKYLSLVYEGRAINAGANNPSSIDKLFGTGGALTRSAYLLVDDLWYNSFVQYGFYRPMFGIQSPNHNALMADYTRLGFRAKVKALGIGTAPNVPFGIANVIMATEGASPTDLASEAGYSVSLGMRFVRLGASITGTYWATENDSDTLPSKTTMWNINGGFKWWRLIANGEMTSVRREVIGLDETKIIGVEGRLRIWREMYAQVGLTQANAAVAIQNTVSGTGISPGKANEISFGLRAFTIAGLDIEMLSAAKTVEEDGFAAYEENTTSMQVHAYF